MVGIDLRLKIREPLVELVVLILELAILIPDFLVVGRQRRCLACEERLLVLEGLFRSPQQVQVRLKFRDLLFWIEINESYDVSAWLPPGCSVIASDRIRPIGP